MMMKDEHIASAPSPEGGRPDAIEGGKGIPPVEFGIGDRLVVPEPRPGSRRVGVAVSVACLSLAAHVAGVALVIWLVQEPRAVAEEQETPVEIVQAPPPPKPAGPEAKPAEAPKSVAEQKPSEAQAPEAKSPETKPPETKPPEPVEAKQNPPSPAAAQRKPPQPAEKPESPIDQAKSASPQPAPDAKPQEQETLQSLKDELAALKEHMSELKEAAVAAAIPNDTYDSLPDSFKAVALPTQSLDGDVPAGYEQQVFSELAKAKKAGRYLETPGTASVVFSIDEQGRLIDVKLTARSGIEALDQEAIATVRRAAPFPPPPKGAKRTFLAAVSFIAEH